MAAMHVAVARLPSKPSPGTPARQSGHAGHNKHLCKVAKSQVAIMQYHQYINTETKSQYVQLVYLQVCESAAIHEEGDDIGLSQSILVYYQVLEQREKQSMSRLGGSDEAHCTCAARQLSHHIKL